MRTFSLLVFAILETQCVHAVRFPFQTRSMSAAHRNLRTRSDVSGQIVNTSNGSVPIANSQNAEYISNITLGGVTIPVMLDTGSSDLWVTGTIPGAVDSGKSTKLDYAVGEATGDINYAPVSFDGYNITDQAFLLVTNTSSFSTNIAAQGFSGLVGLGPNSGSVIRKTIDSDSGDAFIDRIFQQNRTSQNFISLLLDRQGDPGDAFTGQLTISELVSGFESIAQQPKLAVETVYGLTDEDQHWQVLTDKDDGIIGPDGQPIEIDSIVPKAPSGQLVAVLDSGFTLPQVPRTVSDAIYGRVQGAIWDTNNALWTIPCDQLLNLTFKFGGLSFPIHPLDVSSSDFNLLDSQGNPICAGTFQPITSAFSLLGEYDMILGMAFLRNTYTLLDYGSFIDETSNDRGDPFVQLLSVTDVDQAHADFVKVRLNGVDTTNDPSKALLPASQGQSSPESDAEKKAHLEEKILSRWPYILLGCLVFVGIIIGLCIWRCCCRRKGKKGAKDSTLALPLNVMNSPYQQLDDSSPPLTTGNPSAHSKGH